MKHIFSILLTFLLIINSNIAYLDERQIKTIAILDFEDNTNSGSDFSFNFNF